MPTHSGFLAEYPLIRVDMHTDDTPPLPPHLVERLRSGKDASLDATIGDLHSGQTHFRHAEINLLTHLHSDHLMGLADKRKWPDMVICSNATKEMLLRLETQKHRIAMDVDQADPNPPYRHLRVTKDEASAARKLKGSFVQPRDVLHALPLNTPTVIQYTQTTKLTITLIDANHMPGAVMFLIEGPRGAVLHTGDVRAEPWWTEKLRREPVLQRYIAWDAPDDSHNWAVNFGEDEGDSITPPLQSTLIPAAKSASQGSSADARHLHPPSSSASLSSQASLCPPPESTSFVLENIYIDTECLFFTKPALSKTDAVRETVKLIAQFPPSTPVFINCFTWGYEELFIGICRAFGQKIHVDKYKRMMYSQVAPELTHLSHRDSRKRTEIGADSHPFLQRILTLEEDATRFHACERKNLCSWLRQFQVEQKKVDESPTKGLKRKLTSETEPNREATALPNDEDAKHLPSSLPTPSKAKMTESQVDATRTAHMRDIRAKDKVPDLSSPARPVAAESSHTAQNRKRPASSPQQAILHLNPTEMSASSWKRYRAEIQVHIDAAKRGEKPWPRYMFVPFPRHSPLPELQALTALFRPRTITPNTVSKRLGGWVFYILPRLFRAHLHRQDSSLLESVCQGKVGSDNWERAKVKETELFALHLKALRERKKAKGTQTDSPDLSTSTSVGNSTSISIPPPGQGQPASASGDKSTTTTDSDSRISRLLVSSQQKQSQSQSVDEATESALLLLRLIDHYLFRQTPAVLQTMVGDQGELERHVGDLRRLAALNRKEDGDGDVLEDEGEEEEDSEVGRVAEAFVKAIEGSSGVTGEQKHQQVQVGDDTSFALYTPGDKGFPATADYEADVSGAPPKKRSRLNEAANGAAALKAKEEPSTAEDSGSWSIIVPRPGSVLKSVSQRGYDGDHDDEDGEDNDSRSTVRQTPSQSQRSAMTGGKKRAETQSQPSSERHYQRAERSPSLGAPIPSPLWSSLDQGAEDAVGRTQESQSSSAVPSSPPVPTFTSTKKEARAHTSTQQLSLSTETEDSQMQNFPSSPIVNGQARRDAAAAAAAATAVARQEDMALRIVPKIRIEGPQSPEKDEEVRSTVGLRPSSSDMAVVVQDDALRVYSFDAESMLLRTALQALSFAQGPQHNTEFRLAAYVWLAVNFHGWTTLLAPSEDCQNADLRLKVSQCIIADVFEIESVLRKVGAKQRYAPDLDARLTSILPVGQSAARLLARCFTSDGTPMSTLSAALQQDLVRLVRVLPSTLRHGPIVLRLFKTRAVPLEATAWPTVLSTILACAGLLHLLLESAPITDGQAQADPTWRAALDKAHLSLDAFEAMMDEARRRRAALPAQAGGSAADCSAVRLTTDDLLSKRKGASPSVVPATSFFVPPSSSNVPSQQPDLPDDIALGGALLSSNPSSQLLSGDIHTAHEAGGDAIESQGGANAQEGTSMESVAASDAAIERLARNLRYEADQRRHAVAVQAMSGGPSLTRSSLWDTKPALFSRDAASPPAPPPSRRRRGQGQGR